MVYTYYRCVLFYMYQALSPGHSQVFNIKHEGIEDKSSAWVDKWSEQDSNFIFKVIGHCFLWADLSLHSMVSYKKKSFFTKGLPIVQWACGRRCLDLSSSNVICVPGLSAFSQIQYHVLKNWEWSGDDANINPQNDLVMLTSLCYQI